MGALVKNICVEVGRVGWTVSSWSNQSNPEEVRAKLKGRNGMQLKPFQIMMIIKTHQFEFLVFHELYFGRV